MKLWHMNGAGNDFVVLDARQQQLDLSALAIQMCKQTGADGLMAVDESECADFRLHFYNANGARGEMCGNGCRCLCSFAYENQIAGAEMRVETDGGIVRGWRVDKDTYRLELTLPSVVDLHRLPDTAYLELGDPGVPHAVQELPNLSWEDREQLRGQATALRYHPAFPKGANVNFFAALPDGAVQVLTYERYVEGYTLACGTGSAAIACVLWQTGRLPGGELIAHNPGGVLKVRVAGENGIITQLQLEGPVALTEILEK